MRLLVENFHSACQSILHERASPALNYAVGCARAGLSMTDPHEVQVQCRHILSGITHWRGPTAKRCRETFKQLAKPATWNEAA
jgi:hypothetical protein